MESTDTKLGDVEKGLGSRGRLRILRCLSEHLHSALTKYMLKKETGLSQAEVKRHLKILVDIGWVYEGSLTPLTYHLNLKNPVVKNLIIFFEALKTSS